MTWPRHGRAARAAVVRGRPPAGDARSPLGISARGWGRLLRRVVVHVVSDRLMVHSAGVAFFAILSVAPVLVTAMSVYAAVNTPEQAHRQLLRVARMLPAELQPMVADQLTTITAASTHIASWGGVTGLVVALVTATTAMTYLIDGLTLAYRETESRGFLRRTGLAVLFLLGGVLVLGGAVAGVGALFRRLTRAPGVVHSLAPVLTWLSLAVLMCLALAVLYRLGPDREQARWRWTTGGSTVATVLWLAVTVCFFGYVDRLGSYRTTYGGLAGVAISMFWVWTTVFLVIVGAAVNAETERETSRDTTVGPDRPRGERGAVVADGAPPS